jgi:cell division protein FtsI (penicillin-binding protein 3)
MRNEKAKIYFLVGIISLLTIFIFLRLVYFKTVKYSYYVKRSKSQSSRNLTLIKGRGLIYDSKNNPLAVNIKVASLYTNGKNIKDLYRFKRVLKKYGINLSKATIKRIRHKYEFIWIKRGIDIELAEKIHNALSEVNYLIAEDRFYPEHKLASSIIGFTGIDNQGLYGVEKSLDSILKGEEIKLSIGIDNRKRLILTENTIEVNKPAHKIKLSLDMDLEFIANVILKEDIKKFKAKRGGVVGIDVHTGEILFSSFLPTFNPNKFNKYSKRLWNEGSTHFLFEPGSIFKPVTFAYLFDKGLKPDRKIYCEKGRYKIYDHVFKDVHKYETLTVEDVLVLSSNVGTIKLNLKSPKKDFYNFIKQAGFGKKTGVTALSEESGILADYKKWSGLDKPAISMGQAISVTPLQIVRFYAAIANGGTLLTPVLIKDAKGLIKVNRETKIIMSYETSKLLSRILRKVVLEGTGKNAKSQFIDIAGKTGTAQKSAYKKSGYLKNDFVVSFAGFFPADNPKIAMIVLYDSPKESIYGKRSIYGGTTAAVTFRKIAEQIAILNGYNVKKVYLADAN